MGKIRYLVTDKAGRKLRRAVPKALQELAGRTAWVERVEGLRASEVRERANLFAARTDAEIRALERKAAVEPQPKAAGDGRLYNRSVNQAATRRGRISMTHMDTIDALRLAVSGESSRAHKTKFGQFFTPGKTARFMAGLFQRSGGKCRLLDPGAGIGSLSGAFLDRCGAGGLSFESVNVFAYEIDECLHGHLAGVLGGLYAADHRVIGGDFIEAAVSGLRSSDGELFTHAVINPPYKKIRTASRERELLGSVGLETVNLYSGFVAMALALLEKGGELVAIIPRSWCNGPYYRPFRRFILERAALTHIHVFESRRKAFQDDDVLQETIIIRLVRGGEQGDVHLSVSEDGTFSDVQRYTHPFDIVVHPADDQAFVHIPLEEASSPLAEGVFCHRLADLNIGICTGPVVDFRLKPSLRAMPEAGAVPLLYANHLKTGAVVWPLAGGKKPNAIAVDDRSRKWLMPMGTYAVAKRFSSKEEKRRIVAAVVDHEKLPANELIGFENHLNVFHRNKGALPRELAHGLAVYLNSTAMDEHLRRFSGHTQVNATDIRQLPFPSESVLITLGEWAVQHGHISQVEIDAKVSELM